MRKKVAVSLFAPLGMAIFLSCRSDEPRVSMESAAAHVSAPPEREAPSVARERAPLFGFCTNVFVQSFHCVAGKDFFVVRQKELHPVTREWEVYREVFSVPYSIVCITPYDSCRWFVVGADIYRNELIEEWSIDPSKGGYRLVRQPPAGTAMGVPAGIAPIVDSIVGGTYIPMDGRPAKMKITRRLIYRGSDLGRVSPDGVVVDSEGRYLLALSLERDAVCQIAFQPNPRDNTVDVLLTAGDLPHLADVDWMWAAVAGTGEKVFYLESFGPPEDIVSVVVDSDNDGHMDSFETYTFDALSASPYATDERLDNFSDYQVSEPVGH